MFDLGAVDLFIVLGRPLRDSDIQIARDFFDEHVPRTDIVTHAGSVQNLPAVRTTMYLYRTNLDWPEFFSLIRRLKGHFEEREVPVTQLIVLPHKTDDSPEDFGDPPARQLRSERGAWVRPELFEGRNMLHLLHFLEAHGGKRMGERWFVLPFSPDLPNDDSDFDYDPCDPADLPEHFASHLNGSVVSVGAPVGLRVRMSAGATITDYVSRAYCGAVGFSDHLGGSSVILTTLLQMNDKLSFVNTYCEPLETPVALNLLTLPAMNLRVTDERANTDIATLMRHGNLIVTDIMLGR